MNLTDGNYGNLPSDSISLHRESRVIDSRAQGDIQIALDRGGGPAQHPVRPLLEMPSSRAMQRQPLAEEIEVAMPEPQTPSAERLAALDFQSITHGYAHRNHLRELGEDVRNNKLAYLCLLAGTASFGALAGALGRTALEPSLPSEIINGVKQDSTGEAAKVGAFVGPTLFVLGIVGKATVGTCKSLWSINGLKTQIQDDLRHLANDPGCNLRFIHMFADLPSAWDAGCDIAFFKRVRDAVGTMKKHPALAGKIFELAQAMGSEHMGDESIRKLDRHVHSEILKFKVRELPEGSERTEMVKHLYCCDILIPAVARSLNTHPDPTTNQIFDKLRDEKVIFFGGPIAADDGPLDDDQLEDVYDQIKNRLNDFTSPANAEIRLAYEGKLLESEAARGEREARMKTALEWAKNWSSVAVGNVICRNKAEGEPADDVKTRQALELYVWETMPREVANEVSRHILVQRAKGPEGGDAGPDDIEVAADAFEEIMAGYGIRTWIDRGEDFNFNANDSANMSPDDQGRPDKPWAQPGAFATKNWHNSPQLPVHRQIVEARQLALA